MTVWNILVQILQRSYPEISISAELVVVVIIIVYKKKNLSQKTYYDCFLACLNNLSKYCMLHVILICHRLYWSLLIS